MTTKKCLSENSSLNVNVINLSLHVNVQHNQIYFLKSGSHQGEKSYKLETLGISEALLNLFQSFLSNWYEKVVFNGEQSSWWVKFGVPQGSILGPLRCLVYITDLPDNLEAKLFANDTSLFSTGIDFSLSASLLKNDQTKVPEWAYNGKMTFEKNKLKNSYSH